MLEQITFNDNNYFTERRHVPLLAPFNRHLCLGRQAVIGIGVLRNLSPSMPLSKVYTINSTVLSNFLIALQTFKIELNQSVVVRNTLGLIQLYELALISSEGLGKTPILVHFLKLSRAPKLKMFSYIACRQIQF